MNITKHCQSCHTTKPISDFYNNKRTKDGKQAYCKACSKLSQQVYSKNYYRRNKEKICKNVCEWQKQNRDKVTARNRRVLLRSYGINEVVFNEMLLLQNFKCAICPQDLRELNKHPSIDHDHSCCPGKDSCGSCIRGLLCSNCNAAIGLLKNSPELLRVAADYLANNGFFNPIVTS